MALSQSRGGSQSRGSRSGDRLGRRAGENQSGAAVWHEGEERAHHNPDAAEPNPFDEGIEEGVNDRHAGVGILTGVNDVEILAEGGVDGHHGSGRLFVALKLAFFRIQHHDLLLVLAFHYFDDHALGGVILLDLRVGTLQRQRVGAQLQGIADVHRFLDILIEGHTGNSDEDQHHAEMNDVAAIAARVAHGQFVGGHHHVHSRASGNDPCAAVELKETQKEGDKRGELAVTDDEEENRGDEACHQGPTEVALHAVSGGFAPGEERADAGEEQNREADRDHHLVEEGSADADAVIGEPFGEDRKQRAGENGDASDEEKKIVEEETRFAGYHGIELVFALQVVAVLDVGYGADGEGDEDETNKPRADLRIRKGVDGADDAAAR